MFNVISSVFIVLVLLVLVVFGLWWVVQWLMFMLYMICIEFFGDMLLEKVNVLMVWVIVVLCIYGNFFIVDLMVVWVVFEVVFWVCKVMVWCEWLDWLVVKIEEYKVLGIWGEDGKLFLQKGDVFIVNLVEVEDDGDLLEFDGLFGSEKQVVVWLVLFCQWFVFIKLELELLVLLNCYVWIVWLDNGMIVELGCDQGDVVLKEWVVWLVVVYLQLLERLQGKIESVDLCYFNGMVLKVDGMVLVVMNGKKK